MKLVSRGAELFTCSLLLSLCANVSAHSLADELEARSAKDGLGIGRFAESSQIEFVSLNRKATIRTIQVPGLSELYDIEPRTQVLLSSVNDLLGSLYERGISAVKTPTMALLTMDGRRIKTVGLSIWPVMAVVSPKLDLMAVLAYTAPGQIILRYGPLDGSSTTDVFSSNVDESGVVNSPNYLAENFSWSPDEQFLAYSIRGQVYVLDTAKSSKRSIAEGTDPCWSPDGERIAYRSKNQELMIYNVRAKSSERVATFYTVVGFPRWSPDSRYVLFTQSSPILALRNLRTLPVTEFMILRISDRATTAVYSPGGGMDNRRFFWLNAPSKPTLPVPYDFHHKRL